MNKKTKTSETIKKSALCAMLSALGVVLMYFGSLLDVLDLTMATLASMCVIIAIIDAGGVYPWLLYSVTAVVSLLLLPVKSTALYYTVFLGFYPIIKEKIERLPRIFAWIIKIAIFNAAFVIGYFGLKLFAALPDFETYIMVITWVLGQAAFILYDIALTRLLAFYLVKIRPRLFRHK